MYKDVEKRWKKSWDKLLQEKIQAWIDRIPQYVRITCLLKDDNKYKKEKVDDQSNTKKGKKHLVKLITKIETAKVFEKNEYLNNISNCFIFSTIILNNSSTSSDLDISSPFFQIPICYSWLLDSFKNLSWSIIPDLLLLEYNLALVPTIPQRMTPKLEDLANEIPYALSLSFANDKDIFLSEDLLLLPDKDKGKDSIHLWELVADDIFEALKLLLVFLIKKSIKRAKRRFIIHITAATSHPQRGTKPIT